MKPKVSTKENTKSQPEGLEEDVVLEPEFPQRTVDLIFHVYRLNRNNPWLKWKQELLDATNRIFDQFKQGIPVRLPPTEAESWRAHLANSLKRPFESRKDVEELCYWGYQGHSPELLYGLQQLAKKLLSGEDPLRDANKAELVKPETAWHLLNGLGIEQSWKIRTPELEKEIRENLPKLIRDRTGYVQPDRQGKVGVNGFLDPDIHTQYYALAMDVGLTVPQLTTFLATTAPGRAATDPEFRAELLEEGQRIAAKKKQDIEAKKAKVARRNSAIRAVRRAPPKNTPQ